MGVWKAVALAVLSRLDALCCHHHFRRCCCLSAGLVGAGLWGLGGREVAVELQEVL